MLAIFRINIVLLPLRGVAEMTDIVRSAGKDQRIFATSGNIFTDEALGRILPTGP
jgi:hypothetical protein